MPAKKDIDEKSENSVIQQTDTKMRDLDSYIRLKKLSRIIFYRMRYEIRKNPDEKKTLADWDKIYNRVKF